MREKFTFFRSFLDTARELTPELQAKYLMAIAEYALEGREAEDPIIRALMAQTKFTLDRSLEITDSASERGKKWWAPQGNKNAVKNFENLSKQAKTSKNNLTQAKTSEVEVEEEIKKEIKKEKTASAFASLTVGTCFEELDWEVQKVYLDFLEHRKAMWVKNTPQATKQHLNLLKKIGNQELQLATIAKAIGAGWRGLFELTEKEKQALLSSDPPPKKLASDLDFSWFTRDLRWRT